MNDHILVAYKIAKVYNDGARQVRAVDAVDLSVARGSSVSILGPSGAGKSTLLHLLGGLDKPTSGSVLIDGLDIYSFQDKPRSKIRNERIGFIFQFYHLLPEFTALENVMLPAMMKGPGRKARERAMEVLDSVGLAERASHRPGELSGGESQRVAIARAIVNGPEILLCDEPTGNLDSKNSDSIYRLLFDIRSRYGTTLVIVTHDEHISSMTDSSVRLRDGKIA